MRACFSRPVVVLVLFSAGALYPSLTAADPPRAPVVPALTIFETGEAHHATVPSDRVYQRLRWSLVGIQALDVHSTVTAIASGGVRETNFAMKPFASSTPWLLALKGASTWIALRSADTLARRNRRAAFWLLAASNVAMSAIVVHNYRAGGRHR